MWFRHIKRGRDDDSRTTFGGKGLCLIDKRVETRTEGDFITGFTRRILHLIYDSKGTNFEKSPKVT